MAQQIITWVPKKKIIFDKVNTLLEKTIESRQFTNYGPNVQLLETNIREYFQVEDTKSVIAVTNGTIAIQLLAQAFNTDDIEVQWATQSFTFPPSNQCNLRNSRILDIDVSGGINIKDVDESIGGIIVTNIFGNVVDINKYQEWCENKGKKLIFDNAATAFTFYKGRNCVNYGNGCSISFHHTKPFGFGEGGAIIVDKEYENRIRSMVNFGYGLYSNFSQYYEWGCNGKMSDISAAYILQYLDTKFHTIVEKHRALYKYFKDEINRRNICHVKLFPSFHDEGKNVPACFSLLFDEYDDTYEKRILDAGIFCRKYYHPLKELPVAAQVFRDILCIACTTEMTTQHIDTIINLL